METLDKKRVHPCVANCSTTHSNWLHEIGGAAGTFSDTAAVNAADGHRGNHPKWSIYLTAMQRGSTRHMPRRLLHPAMLTTRRRLRDSCFIGRVLFG